MPSYLYAKWFLCQVIYMLFAFFKIDQVIYMPSYFYAKLFLCQVIFMPSYLYAKLFLCQVIYMLFCFFANWNFEWVKRGDFHWNGTDIIRKVDQVVSEKKAFFWFLVSMWHFKSELSSKHLAVWRTDGQTDRRTDGQTDGQKSFFLVFGKHVAF